MKKHLMSFLLFFIVIFITFESGALPTATIVSIKDEGGVAITGGTPGKVIRLEGSDFGATMEDKNVTLWFIRPEPCYIDLEIIRWADSVITARVPSLASWSYRYATTDTTPGPLPEDLKEYFIENSADGYLMITDLVGSRYEEYSNRLAFTLERFEISIATSMREVIPIGAPPPCCKALHVRPPRVSPLGTICAISGPVVRSISPTSGPPGAYVEISGACLGDSSTGNSIQLMGGSNLNPIDVNLEIVSWTDRSIIARIPSPDRIRNVGGHYMMHREGTYDQSSTPLNYSVHVYLGRNDVRGPEFTIVPYDESSPPVICNLDKTSILAGNCLMIYGTQFGPAGRARGEVFYKNGGEIVNISDPLWTSTVVRACLPNDIEPGEYEIYVTRYSGRARIKSNTLNFNVIEIRAMPLEMRYRISP